MIVIFSCDGDYSSDLVIDWLNYYEKPYLRINLYDFLISQVSGPVSYNLFERKIDMGDKVIHLDKIKSVWLRKLGFLDSTILRERASADGIKDRFLKIILQEIQPFFEHLFFELRHCNWICHASNGESGEIDHPNPDETDQSIRSKLTTHIRTKLTTHIRANCPPA